VTEGSIISGNDSSPASEREAAEAAGLVYVSDEQPGIRRRRSGKGFSYIGPGGRAVRDEGTLKRIRTLAVPPAYKDVWICPDPKGHNQATGRDDKGLVDLFDQAVEDAHVVATLEQGLADAAADEAGPPVTRILSVTEALPSALAVPADQFVEAARFAVGGFVLVKQGQFVVVEGLEESDLLERRVGVVEIDPQHARIVLAAGALDL
jgi:hypothetical protein